MAKALSTQATNQLNNNNVLVDYTITINSIVCKDVITYSIDASRDFGCQTLQLTLNNDSGKYSPDGTSEVNLRDDIVLIEKFAGATDTFKSFTGYVTQRNIVKDSSGNIINLTCLDYIVKLQDTDVDHDYEATKYLVENEVLTPNYLPEPNEMFSSIFDFANSNLAVQPPVSIRIRDKTTELEDPQWNGYELANEVGQITLGAVLNARDNYEIVGTYYFYPKGIYVEDIIEDLITRKDGYNNYLFKETSQQAVIDNHLTETFYNVEGRAYDTLTRNKTPEVMDIETTLSVAVAEGDTTITVADASGFPNTGFNTLFSVNGDLAAYRYITGSQIYGIPSSGVYALQSHPIGSYVTYTANFPANMIWYLSYDNLISVMSGSQFTLPPGITMRYFNKRYGSIMLDTPVDPASDIRCNYNYEFKTLQATGVETNGIKFKERDINNRFDAISKLRTFLPPNYIIRTIGDDKIWASYLSQKDTADFDLKGIKSISYGEDEDIYTRTLFYGKNENPHNVFFDTGVSFLNTGETYTAVATNSELSYSTDDGAYRVYVTGLQSGKILGDMMSTVTGSGYSPIPHPVVYINNIPIDNNLHEVIQTDVLISTKTTSTTKVTDGGWSSGPKSEEHTYYEYKIYFGHRGLVANQLVKIYGATGNLLFTLGPNDSNIDYENGIWIIPGTAENSNVAACSNASYWIMYSTDDLQIDFSNVQFKINRRLIPVVTEAIVHATFEYSTVATPIENAVACFDGRWDTQTQTIFYAKPPQGFVYGIVDLGEIKDIQLIDIIAGFFKPDTDGRRKYEMTNYITLKYSLDNRTYNDIASDTTNFALTSGKTKTFDEQVLGEGFQARYFKIIIEDLEKLEYTEKGLWALSLVEIKAYNDIVLRGECKLIPTTALTSVYTGSMSTLNVTSTAMFISGSGFAYINSGAGVSTSRFWYSGKTATSFTGVTGAASMGYYTAGTKVYDYEETSTSLYDADNLLDKLYDVVYKNTTVNEYLDDQTLVNLRAKDWLTEALKNHTKLDVELLYAPHLLIGHTVALNDPYNRVTSNYFVERKSTTNAGTSITVARYP